MRRSFVHLWLVSILLFVVGLAAQEGLSRWFLGPAEIEWIEGISQGSARCHRDEVLAAADPEAAALAASRRAGYPLQIVSLEDHPSQAATDPELRWIEIEGQWSLGLPLRDGRWLAVGPLPDYPNPWLWPRLALAVVVASALAVGFWLILRPLDRTQRAVVDGAQRLAAGQLDARIGPELAEGSGGMAAAFDTMAERLQSLIRSQREVLRAASHELRTPIARMRIAVHLLATADDPSARESHERGLDGDLTELDDLVDEILVYSRLDAGLDATPPERFELAPLCRALAKTIGSDGPRLELDIEEGIELSGDARLVRRALRNLVANARRHAREGVWLRTSRLDGRVVIEVADDGPGIDLARREEVKLPFVSLDGQGGHGLGLAIVDRIAQLHQIDFDIGEAKEGGVSARLVWTEP